MKERMNKVVRKNKEGFLTCRIKAVCISEELGSVDYIPKSLHVYMKLCKLETFEQGLSHVCSLWPPQFCSIKIWISFSMFGFTDSMCNFVFLSLELLKSLATLVLATPDLCSNLPLLDEVNGLHCQHSPTMPSKRRPSVRGDLLPCLYILINIWLTPLI